MRHNRDIMPVDGAVLKADYLIHYELSLAALAENYGIDYTHLCEVAAREHWQQEREIRSFRIQKDALDRSAHDQVAELADFDSECLRQAKAILGTVSIVLAEHRKPHEIRSLAVAVESAQRIGRLCLGAAIETTHQIPSAFDVEGSRQRLFEQMLAAQGEDASQASCGDDSAVQ